MAMLLELLDIARESPEQPEVAALLSASDAHMAMLYPDESNHMLEAAWLNRSDVTFLVARINGEAVACAALVRPAADWAEIKRMYVLPEKEKSLRHAADI